MRYTLDGSYPTATSTIYSQPVEITGGTKMLTAASFDKDVQIGHITRVQFSEIQPRYRYKLYHAPAGGWSKLPDLSKLTPAASGVAVNMYDIRKVESLYSRYALALEGQFEIAQEGEYGLMPAADIRRAVTWNFPSPAKEFGGTQH